INDVSMFLFVVNVGWSLFKGKRAGNDPWGAGTLEWSVPSPPPAYNFLALPVVASREPLWSPARDGATHVSGLSTRIREGLVTTVLDAQPDTATHIRRPRSGRSLPRWRSPRGSCGRSGRCPVSSGE